MEEKTLAYFAMLLVTFAWGTVYVLGKAYSETISPLSIAFWRLALAGACLLPFSGIWKLRDKDLRTALLAGVLLAPMSPCLFYGVSMSTATNGGILQNTYPLMIAVLAPLVLGEEKKSLFCVFAGYVGVLAVVLNGKLPWELLESSHLPGNMVLLTGAFFTALHLLTIRKTGQKNLLAVTNLSFVTAAIVLLPVVLAEQAFVVPGEVVPILIYLGVFTMGFAYSLWYWSASKLGTTVVSYIGFLVPINTMLLAFVLLGEKPSFWLVGGMFLIVAGLFRLQR